MSPQGDYWLDPERGICWCIIPKCASTTLDVVLGSDRRVYRDEALASGLQAVVFVRHPWERIMSALAHPLHTRAHPLGRLHEHVVGKPMDELNIHVRPQWTFVDGFDLAFVGRLETMESDWTRLSNELGVVLPPLVHENRKIKPMQP